MATTTKPATFIITRLAWLFGIFLPLTAPWADCSSPGGQSISTNSGGSINVASGIAYICSGTTWVSITTTTSSTACTSSGTFEKKADGYLYLCNGSTWQKLATGTTSGTCTVAGQQASFGGRLHTCNGTNWERWCRSGETPVILSSDNIAYCWGYNDPGRIGDGGTATRATPSIVYGGFTDWTKVSAGYIHSCGIRNGLGYCWGDSEYYQLGYSGTADRTTPSLIYGGYTDWTDISAGSLYSCGIQSGRAYCWGSGTSYRLGHGTTADRTTPSLVAGGFTDWTSISAGFTHSCGIRNGGMAFCWGDNGWYQLGDGTGTSRATPTIVSGSFTDWTSISVGYGHTCGLRSNGQAYCWGAGSNGRLGDGASADRTTPSLIYGGYTDWSDIKAGYNHTCGIRDGNAYCWGYGAYSQLGYGGTSNRTTPSLVSGSFTDWVKIDAGAKYTVNETFSCGVRSNGTVYCWGDGTYNRLGDNSTSIRSTPSIVYGGFTDWSTGISGGYAHGCNIRISVTSQKSC